MVKKADNFFVKFDCKEKMSVLKPFGNTATAISYDETEKAALVVPTANGAWESGGFEFHGFGDADCREYPVFAMRVKLKNPESKFGRFYWRTEEVMRMRDLLGPAIDCWQFVLKANFTYEKTADWQTMYVDFSDIPHPYFVGNWLVTMLTPFNATGEGVTTDDGLYIDWMGWFGSMADAHEYAGEPYEAPAKPEIADPLEKRAMESSLRICNSAKDLPKIKSEKVLISDYDPEVTFKHHPGIAYYNGKIYASFSNTPADEDVPGQKIVYCVSDDFYHWSEPMDLVVPGVTPCTKSEHTDNPPCIIGGVKAACGQLYCSFVVIDFLPEAFDENGKFMPAGNRKATYRNYIMYSEDGLTWTDPVPSSSSNIHTDVVSPFGEHQRYVAHGKLNILSKDGKEWVVRRATDEKLADSDARCSGHLTESSGYQGPDGVFHNIIRSECGYVWNSESYDEGETWTGYYPTNFTSASTMPVCTYTPDGRIVWIGSPYYDVRWPLALYVSEDGYNFDKGYVIRDEMYEMQHPGYAKGGPFAYPYLEDDGEYLYILYSKQKEVIEITRIKWSDI
ncbi:MAG: exo-alpha-sialidase [Clostridia bacterium]|nr:exo-alpha-sialidase [Clostridia bacterium]